MIKKRKKEEEEEEHEQKPACNAGHKGTNRDQHLSAKTYRLKSPVLFGEKKAIISKERKQKTHQREKTITQEQKVGCAHKTFSTKPYLALKPFFTKVGHLLGHGDIVGLGLRWVDIAQLPVALYDVLDKLVILPTVREVDKTLQKRQENAAGRSPQEHSLRHSN